MKKLISNIKHLKQKIMSEQCKFQKGDKVRITKNIHNKSTPKVGSERTILSTSKSTTTGRQHLWYITFEALPNNAGGGNAYSDEIESALTQKENLLDKKCKLNEAKNEINKQIKDINATLAIMKKHGVDEMSPELEKVFLVSEEIEELNIDAAKAERIARILTK
jgi:hypothetical protein